MLNTNQSHSLFSASIFSERIFEIFFFDCSCSFDRLDYLKIFNFLGTDRFCWYDGRLATLPTWEQNISERIFEIFLFDCSCSFDRLDYFLGTHRLCWYDGLDYLKINHASLRIILIRTVEIKHIDPNNRNHLFRIFVQPLPMKRSGGRRFFVLLTHWERKTETTSLPSTSQTGM